MRLKLIQRAFHDTPGESLNSWIVTLIYHTFGQSSLTFCGGMRHFGLCLIFIGGFATHQMELWKSKIDTTYSFYMTKVLQTHLKSKPIIKSIHFI